MNSRILATGIAILGFVLIGGQAASAVDVPRYYIGASDAWSTGGNWDDADCAGSGADGVPASGDSVIICPSNTVTMVGNHSAPAVRIENDGILITSTYILTVSGSGGLDIDPCVSGCTDPGLLRVSGAAGEVKLSGGGSHPLDGEIRLEVDDARLRAISSAPTFNSPASGGFILGQNNGAEILADGVQLNCNIDVRGRLNITDGASAGTFICGADVEANTTTSGDVLLVDVGTLDDVSGAEWKVSGHANAHLRLSPTTQNNMVGAFSVTLGKIEIDKALVTTGGLTIVSGVFQVDATTTMGSNDLSYLGGEIVVASLKTFTHN